MSHLCYNEYAEVYSQNYLEEQDFQRHAAPVHYSEPPREPTYSCKYCDGKGNMRGPYQDPFPHYGGFPNVCTDHMNLEFMDDVWVFSQEIRYLQVGEGHTWEAINNLRDRFDALEKILLN